MSSFSGGQLLVSLGSLLDDLHWHTVKLERLNTHLNLTVDKNTHQVRVPNELSHWDIHQVRTFTSHNGTPKKLFVPIQKCTIYCLATHQNTLV